MSVSSSRSRTIEAVNFMSILPTRITSKYESLERIDDRIKDNCALLEELKTAVNNSNGVSDEDKRKLLEIRENVNQVMSSNEEKLALAGEIFTDLNELMLGLDSSLASHMKEVNKRKAMQKNANKRRKLAESDDDEESASVGPIYCSCRRGEFGAMVGCDRCDEWFHYECVHLVAAPESDWYCAECRAKQ